MGEEGDGKGRRGIEPEPSNIATGGDQPRQLGLVRMSLLRLGLHRPRLGRRLGGSVRKAVPHIERHQHGARLQGEGGHHRSHVLH